jgi:molybdopterin converting factor small subunit
LNDRAFLGRRGLARQELASVIHVRFPTHLRRHFPVPPDCRAAGATVAEVVRDLERQFPGLAAYLVHEDGSLRQHVNIFVGERFVRDRRTLSDTVDGSQPLFVMQALSGG